MDAPIVAPPLRGEWKVLHNPGDTPFALDFVGLHQGRRLPSPPRSVLPHVFYRTPASNAYGWDRPVYAPFDGEVVDARDGYPDVASMNLLRDVVRNFLALPGDEDGLQRFAGNYVVVESSDEVAFMAHLRRGSVAVEPGTRVDAGQQIGTVGNSGASLLPHLHFQVIREWSEDLSRIERADLPYRFTRYDRLRDGTWEQVENRRPESGERIRATVETDRDA